MTYQSIAGVGISKDADAFRAGVSAAQQAHAALGDLPPVFAIAYATVTHDPKAFLRGVRSVFSDVPVVGGTAQGISYLDGSDESDRVAGVAAVGSTVIRARAAHVVGVGGDSEGKGRELATSLGASGENPLLLWYDPLTGLNIDALLNGLAQGGFDQVVGGATSQMMGTVHQTQQFCNDEVLIDGAVGLLIAGCTMETDLTHGTEPVGLEMEITKSEGTIIYEIDGEPALDAWPDEFESTERLDLSEIISWAIGVSLPEELVGAYEGPITRAIFGIDAEARSITLQAPIPAGTVVQLCHRTPEAVMDRAIAMAKRLHDKLEGRRPILSLSFECGGRPSPFLGPERALAEVQQMQAHLGGNVPWFGLYAWGELAPIQGRTFFHNFTFPLCVLCE